MTDWRTRNNAIDYASRIAAIRETESLCTNCQADVGLHREDLMTLPLTEPGMVKLKRPTARRLHLCPGCKGAYSPRRTSQIYCSKSCGNADWKRQNRRRAS